MQVHPTEQLGSEPSGPYVAADPPASLEDFLAKIRREFPNWGILVGTCKGRWVAVRGRLEITAADGITLRERLLAATQHERRPR